MPPLTDSERQVAECIAAGMSDQQILAERSITLRQLQAAIKSIYLKSEAQCVRALVVWCQRATALKDKRPQRLSERLAGARAQR